jgi:hypothetical protein
MSTHATWPEGGISTEAGIQEMFERMKTERLKVASHLQPWFEEFISYHRKDGIIVKERDDLMSATRIAVMAKRFARIGPIGSRAGRRVTNRELNSDAAIAARTDWPLW